MKFIKNYIKNKINRYIAAQVDDYFHSHCESHLRIHRQYSEYLEADDSKLSSKVEALTKNKDILNNFQAIGVPLLKETVLVEEFEEFLKAFPEMTEHYQDAGDARMEKCLEHYLSLKQLRIGENDCYMDVAASGSPWARLLRDKGMLRKYFIQDLVYPEGCNANHMIGGCASKMPLADNSIDKISLHCALECFQGDSDIGLFKEVARVLRPGGRIVSLPLYVDNHYFVKTGPLYDRDKIEVEQEAELIWRDDSYKFEPFSRHYSPAALMKRVIDNSPGLDFEIIHILNIEKLQECFPTQRFYCNFILTATKR